MFKLSFIKKKMWTPFFDQQKRYKTTPSNIKLCIVLVNKIRHFITLVWRLAKFGSLGFLSRTRLAKFADLDDSEMEA